MFRSDWIEIVTHVPVWLPFAIWVPVVVYFIFLALSSHQMNLSQALITAIGAWVSWSFAEYALHRFIFHFPAETKLLKRLHFILHGVHHDDPNDPTRLLMPPPVAAGLALIFYFLFKLVFAGLFAPPLAKAITETYFSCFVIGYLAYDYTHYAAHHFKPKTKVGRLLKTHHMAHHFKNSHCNWGVSSALWDIVFATNAKSRASLDSVKSGRA